MRASCRYPSCRGLEHHGRQACPAVSALVSETGGRGLAPRAPQPMAGSRRGEQKYCLPAYFNVPKASMVTRLPIWQYRSPRLELPQVRLVVLDSAPRRGLSKENKESITTRRQPTRPPTL